MLELASQVALSASLTDDEMATPACPDGLAAIEPAFRLAQVLLP